MDAYNLFMWYGFVGTFAVPLFRSSVQKHLFLQAEVNKVSVKQRRKNKNKKTKPP